jgi:acetylornithine deacetylase
MLDVLELARAMIAFDTRSAVSNAMLVDALARHLGGWQVEVIDYVDADGITKRNLVARDPGSLSRLAFAGHTDTVSAAGWQTDPFDPRIENDRLFGLGATDMKGPVAAFIVASLKARPRDRPTLVLTADEETTKQGVREVVARSRLLAERRPACFIVAEPTALGVVRGHRVDVQFTVRARGRQAHSSTGRGLNANLAMIPFLVDLRALHLRLREDVSLHDPHYEPPFCDLNFVLDNHGTLPNTTPGLATCRIKFRYSKAIDPAPVVESVRRSAETHGLEVEIRPEAAPPELPPDAPEVRALEAIVGGPARVMGLGTEASEYSRLAPTLVFGPGDLDEAHRPSESIDIGQLRAAEDAFARIARDWPAPS